MADLLQYKCPSCGGRLEFNSTVQMMKCPYCDTEFEVETLRSFDADLQKEGKDDLHWETNAGGEWAQGETDGLKVYNCQSCGGEIICEESTAASKCPYCDNPIVMKGNFSGALKPDVVIPFKLDKKAAKEAYYRHLEGKKFLPKVFREENHIDEIKGLYVPFWLFDADVDAHIRYKGTTTRVWSDSDYDYVETSFYSIIRGGNIAFDNVPVDGSLAMPDDLMESVEPFDFSQAVDFQTAYLSGYLADKYTVTVEDSIDAANRRIRTSTAEAFADTVMGYETLSVEGSSINLSHGKAKYAMYPVWILNTTWQGQRYVFAMNGQTGKMVGNLPLDKAAYWRNTFLYGGVTAAVVFGATVLLWFMS